LGWPFSAENNAKIVLERGEQPLLDRAGDDRWPTVPDNFRHRDVE